jgi:hypothetical protein
MNMNSRSWPAVLITLLILCVINMHCWKPGIGGRNDKIDGKQIEGTELEIYLGWPACYRAELWRSDESLTMDLLKRAPFFRIPKSMRLVDHYLNAKAITIDILFAFSSMSLVGIVWNARKNQRWSAKTIVIVVFLAALILFCYIIGETFSAHL